MQVNGKVRGVVDVPADIAEERARDAGEGVRREVGPPDGKEIVREIVVPGKIVNFVVR